MSRPIASGHAGTAASTKRLKKSTATLTSVASTGVFTITPAGFLNELAPGDNVLFTGLTGGSGVTQGIDYYLLGPRWALAATTFKVSATPGGAPLTGGTNITAGTCSTGSLTAVEDGVLSGNYISADSPLGR